MKAMMNSVRDPVSKTTSKKSLWISELLLLAPYCEDISKRDTICSSNRHCLNTFHVVNGTYNKITYGIYFVAYTTREFRYGFTNFTEVLLWFYSSIYTAASATVHDEAVEE